MHRSRAAGALAALLALLAAPAARPAEGVKAVPLRKVAGLARLDPGWREGLCRLPGIGCPADGAEPALHGVEAGELAGYYLLGPGPSLVRLDFTRGKWRVVHRWDFSAVAAAEGGASEAGGGEPAARAVHPALYPAGPGRWAAALTRTVSEGYAGGGAGFTFADFYLLDPAAEQVAPAQRLHEAVPFGCWASLRACFGEPESRRSPHCSDDYRGWLTLAFQPGADPQRYQWSATWHEEDWPGNAPRKATTRKATPLALDGAGEAPVMCNGGPQG